MKKATQPTKQQIESWKSKADKWDQLENKIFELILDEDGNELPEDEQPDLLVIGEIAVNALGL